MDDTSVRDEQVLELRVHGKSFAGIAKTLGFGRPYEANDAFNRALRRKPAAERDTLRSSELIRLDALAEAVRANLEMAPDDVARRLRTLDRMRARLLAD